MDVMIEPRPDTAVVIREPSKGVCKPGKSYLIASQGFKILSIYQGLSSGVL